MEATNENAIPCGDGVPGDRQGDGVSKNGKLTSRQKEQIVGVVMTTLDFCGMSTVPFVNGVATMDL